MATEGQAMAEAEARKSPQTAVGWAEAAAAAAAGDKEGWAAAGLAAGQAAAQPALPPGLQLRRKPSPAAPR